MATATRLIHLFAQSVDKSNNNSEQTVEQDSKATRGALLPCSTNSLTQHENRRRRTDITSSTASRGRTPELMPRHGHTNP